MLTHKPIQAWIAPTLCILFAILWGVWLLPHTVFIRHTAMILGAFLGLYVCIENYYVFLKKEGLPVYCVLLLLIWVTFHLFFVGTEYEVQRKEYMGVWIKTILCTPFALGMGIAVAKSKNNDNCWNIFYIGLTLPVFIYYIKLIITGHAAEWGIENPHLLLNSDHTGHLFGVSRALYPFYCFPSFATGVFLLLRMREPFSRMALLYFGSAVLTPLLFYLEGDRTGLLLTVITFIFATVNCIREILLRPLVKSKIIGILLIILLITTSLGFVKKFDQIQFFFANTSIALDINSTEEWKYQGARGIPTNQYGKQVDISNYYRVAWALAGIKLLQENPLGYGLLTLSFERLSKQKWENSLLGLTHSGWIDFSLGYGILGLLLFIGASFGVWVGSFNLVNHWKIFVFWGFGFLNIVFLMKEISYEIVVNAFIFLILFIGALNCSINLRIHNSKV